LKKINKELTSFLPSSLVKCNLLGHAKEETVHDRLTGGGHVQLETQHTMGKFSTEQRT